MLGNRKWIGPATSVVALLMSAASASAGPNMWSNFYISVFGGAAAGTGGTTAHGENQSDAECNVFGVDPEYCIYDAVGAVNNGAVGGMAFGTTLAPNTRVEGEFSFGSFGTTTKTTAWDPEANSTYHGSNPGSLSTTFLFGNIWYDIPIGGQFTAYLGGGAGFAHASGTFAAPITTPYTSTDLSLMVNGFAPAIQVGGGVNFAVAPNVSLDFGYRFKSAIGLAVSKASSFDNSLTNVTYSKSMNLGVHVFQVGLNFAIN